MWLNEDDPILKQDIILSPPFVNAPGFLGFTPDPHSMPFLDHLGAFITNPISQKPRKPANDRCCLPFEGGFLIHSGCPNPGIHNAIRQFKQRWANSPIPVIVHLLCADTESTDIVVRKLEGLENILAVELGLPPTCNPELLSSIMEAAAGELPAVPRINPDQIPLLLETLIVLNPPAVHLGQPRGTLPGFKGMLVTGRLYGPAVFPTMLSAAQLLVNSKLRVIVDGGVYRKYQIDALFQMGVVGIGLGGILWQVDFGDVFSKQNTNQ